MEPASTVSFSEKSSFEPVRPSRGNKKIIGIVAIILVIIGLVFLGIQNARGKSSQEKITPTIEQTPTEEPTQEPTPEEEVTPTGSKTTPSPRPTSANVSSARDLAIQVLNGNGKVGGAGEVRDFLKGKGYLNLATANADNFDYQGVSIKIKSSRNKFLSTLQSDLKEKYTISASGSSTLAESADYDAQVIVGK